MEGIGFKEPERELRGLTASAERKALAWLARRMPPQVNSDHLTLLGLLAMLAAGAFYAMSRRHPLLLHAVNLCLAANWFGDSLDGTLARWRHRQRPRYGFYVDHLVDAFGALFLFVGLGLSGHMSEKVAWGLLVAYQMLSIQIGLATQTTGVFKISYGPFGGTELRILLAIGNLALLHDPWVRLFGEAFLLYDLLGTLGIAGLAVVLIVSAARNTRTLYLAERV